MAGDEDVALIFARRRIPRVETCADRGDVSTECEHRRREFGTGALIGKFWIGYARIMAIGKAVILIHSRHTIELVGG